VWRAGGDILLMTTVNLKDWTTPTPIFTEEEDGTIPKVISNPPVEVGGHWVLPYWRQNPRGVSVCQVCDLLNQLPERERECPMPCPKKRTQPGRSRALWVRATSNVQLSAKDPLQVLGKGDITKGALNSAFL
jgi:hypothetical protein